MFIGCGGGSGGNSDSSSAYSISFYDENLDFLNTTFVSVIPSGTWYKANEDTPLTNYSLNSDIRLYAVPNVTEITDQTGLDNVRNDLSGKYILMNDINLDETKAGFETGKGWKPIGYDYYNSFTGIFNGDFHKITNLWIDRPDEIGIGFFGVVEGGNTRNLGVEIAEDKEVRGDIEVGGIAGYVEGEDNKLSIIINSYVIGNVSGNEMVGGIAGTIGGSNIINSYVIGNVSGNEMVGGIAGLVTSGGGSRSAVTNSYSIGNISGTEGIGGIAGVTYGGNITNSYSSTRVNGEEHIGGIVGVAYLASTIQYNAAINPFVYGNYAVNKIAGGIAGEITSNNFALDDINITPVGYYDGYFTYEDFNGISKTLAELKTKETYSNATDNGGLGWKFGNDKNNPWQIDANKNNGFPYFYWQEL